MNALLQLVCVVINFPRYLVFMWVRKQGLANHATWSMCEPTCRTNPLQLWRPKHQWNGETCDRCGDKAPRCSAVSGTFYGYQCDLGSGHSGRHEAVTSVTKNGWGTEIGRTTLWWES